MKPYAYVGSKIAALPVADTSSGTVRIVRVSARDVKRELNRLIVSGTRCGSDCATAECDCVINGPEASAATNRHPGASNCTHGGKRDGFLYHLV